MSAKEVREGVELTHLDEPLFDQAGATKRDLVEYLDRASAFILPELQGRPLSVIRAHRGEEPFMQKNLPKYTPDWVTRAELWADASQRNVSYALCNDRRTLIWFANQRAVEYHPSLVTADDPAHMTHLVIDLDPPGGGDFGKVIEVARAARQALAEAGLQGAVKTSGAKGIHIWVPVADAPVAEAAAATRALAARTRMLAPDIATTQMMKSDRAGRVFVDATRSGAATVVAAFSPRARPGVPVSFPVRWDDLGRVEPGQFDLHALERYESEARSWARNMPEPQPLPSALVEEGSEIPIPRVAAMHEGRRRARAQRTSG